MPKRRPDARVKALLAQRPPADAVSYMPPPGRLSLIIKLVGTDQDRLTRPGDRGLFCYTDQLSYRPGEQVRFHTSTSAARYSIEIARVGARREVVWTRSGIRGALHATARVVRPGLRLAGVARAADPPAVALRLLRGDPARRGEAGRAARVGPLLRRA